MVNNEMNGQLFSGAKPYKDREKHYQNLWFLFNTTAAVMMIEKFCYTSANVNQVAGICVTHRVLS